MATMASSAKAMTFTQAQQEALFLSDKMAYELNLSVQQYEAVYEINLDYMMALSMNDDIFGFQWERRNEDLSYVLSVYQYRTYMSREYFYRPVYWQNGFAFRIYTNYSNRSHFYYARPSQYATYRGAHNWHNNGNKSYYKGRVYDRDRTPQAYSNVQPRNSVNRNTTGRNSYNRGNAAVNRNRNTTAAPQNNQRRNWHSNNNSSNRPSRR